MRSDAQGQVGFWDQRVAVLEREMGTVESQGALLSGMLPTEYSDLKAALSPLHDQQGFLLTEIGNRQALLNTVKATAPSEVNSLTASQAIHQTALDNLVTEGDNLSYAIDQASAALSSEYNLLTARVPALDTQRQNLLAEQTGIYGQLDTAMSLASGEYGAAYTQHNRLTVQRSDLNVRYQDALVNEPILAGQESGLQIELSGLHTQASDLHVQAGGLTTTLAQLDAQDATMMVDLGVTLQTKQLQRGGLKIDQTQAQLFQVGFLALSHDLQSIQYNLDLATQAADFRGLVSDAATQRATAQVQLELLRAQQSALADQLTAAQPTGGLNNVRIHAGQGQMPSGVEPTGAGGTAGTWGNRLAQDPFSGYYIYLNQTTEETYYRDARGTSRPAGMAA